MTTLNRAPLTANARTVLEKRYLLRKEDGTFEEPEELFARVAHTVAAAESNFGAGPAEMAEVEAQFLELLTSLRFLPNSPTLRNAGRSGTFSGCFVVPISDSMEGIMDGAKQAAMVMKHGGGLGYDFSELRPEGDLIESTHGGACGPVRVMQMYSLLSDTFTQGGSFRVGAQMHILRCDHPDIFKFIHCKDDGVSILHANISVAVTEDFIETLNGKNDYQWPLQFNGRIYKTVYAPTLWQEIAESAWKTGDPGLIFIDRANGNANPLSHMFDMRSTNPCGEQYLGPYENCNLGHISVEKYIDSAYKSFDWVALRRDIQLAVHFLDNVVEVNQMPTLETAVANKRSRRIGLGIMGWADALAKLHIPYASKEALDMAESLMSSIQTTADDSSLNLGEMRGPYEAYPGSLHEKQNLPYRNAFRLSLAPTGTTSIIAGASFGIEPIFATTWERRMEDGTPLQEGGSYAEDIQTAMDIAPEWHVRMQAAFQKYVDNSISKTINMPHSATVEDVKAAYKLALDLGCKGITIYRDGSRDVQVLTPKETPVTAEQLQHFQQFLTKLNSQSAKPLRRRLPDERQALNHKFSVGDMEGYLNVGMYEDGQPGEIFVSVSKQGSTVRGLLDVLGQLTSVALQYGVPLDVLVNKLSGSRYEPSGMTSNPRIPQATSLTDYIFRFLRLRWGSNQTEDKSPLVLSLERSNGHHPTAVAATGMICPDCGALVLAAEGCLSCPQCGWSRCG